MTAESLENLLAGATRDFHTAADKKARGENESARRLFLQAAEKLMLAAGQIPGFLAWTVKNLPRKCWPRHRRLNLPREKRSPGWVQSTSYFHR